MNAGPFSGADERGNVPEARRASGKRDEANIPDWAKITADISGLPDDDTDEFESIPEEKPTVAANDADVSPFGSSSREDVVPGLDDLDAVEPELPSRAEETTPTREPDYDDFDEDEDEGDEDYEEEEYVPPAPPVSRERKPKRYIPMKKALTNLPAHQYQEPAENKSSAKGKKFNGGRWKVLALRAGVWSSFGIILLVGVFTIIGPKGPSVNAITNNVLSEINRNAFPIEEGEQVASRFIERYMEYDPESSFERTQELSQYLVTSGSGASSAVSLFSGDRPQVVVDGPYLAKPVELLTDDHVVYTFAVEVENPSYIRPDPNDPQSIQVLEPIPARWVYLAVPMVADEEGHLAVAGAPAVVPQPPKADGVEEIRINVDRNASLEAKDSMTEFFRLWAESYQEGLRPYLVVGESTQDAQIGLQGSAEFVALNALDVEKLPDGYEPDPEVPPMCSGPDYEAPCRVALATVTWKFIDGTEFAQNYRLIIFNDGQNWRVIDVKGGKFDSIGR